MTITVPTGDLTGILADVIPFAGTDKDFPTLNVVRLEWDGRMLHALATDRYQIGTSAWHPDDDPPGEAQDDLFTEWGGADEPWVATVALDDAKDLVAAYKLGPKERQVPLTVDANIPCREIKVVRSRDTGHSAITMVVRDQFSEFPDVRAFLVETAAVPEAVETINLDARRLANFAKVRQFGPIEMTFGGPKRPTRVAIGNRFVGAVMPVRIGENEEA